MFPPETIHPNSSWLRRVAHLLLALLHAAAWVALADESPTPTIPELEARLEKSEGRERIDILLKLSSLSERKSTDDFMAYAQQALALSEELNDAVGEGRSHNNLGLAYLNLGQPEQAWRHLAKAIEIWRRLDHAAWLANSLGNAGHVFMTLGDQDRAMSLFSEALDIRKEMNDERGMAGIYHSISTIYSERGDFDRSIEFLNRALTIAERLDFTILIGQTCINLGINFFYQGKYDKARESYVRAIDIFEASGNKTDLLQCLNGLGVILNQTGQYQDGLSYYKKAFDMSAEMGDKESMGMIANNLGIVYYEIGGHDTALSYYLQSLSIEESIPNPRGIARTCGNLGNLYCAIGQRKKGKAQYDRALQIYRDLGATAQVAGCLNSLGSAFEAEDDDERAATYFQEAYDMAEKIGTKPLMVTATLNLGVLESKRENHQKARACFLDALHLSRELGDQESRAKCLLNLGRVEMDEGHLDAAQTRLEAALDMAESMEIRSLMRDVHQALSLVAEQTGDPTKALAHFREYHTLFESTMNEEAVHSMSEMEARYELERHEREKADLRRDQQILEQQARIQALSLSREKFKVRALIAISVLVLLLFLWFGQRFLHLLAFWKRKSLVGHYRILEELGSGGMGVVYRAVNVVKDAEHPQVALKLLREESSTDPLLRRRFLHEALIVDRLNHPHIVKVVERGMSGDRLFLAMEWIDAPSLARFIEQSEPLSSKICVQFLLQMADILEAVHAKGVIHRDIKPENIMCVHATPSGFHIKLLDFGLAKSESLTELTVAGEILGTMAYLPPERISQQETSAPGDIYSTGAVAFEMATRKPPFASKQPAELLKQILEQSPPSLHTLRPDLPESLGDLIHQMLDRDPRQRPTAPDLRAALERIQLEDLP